MKCKRCGAKMPDAKRTCSRCGAFLEGYTLNNVTGEYGYRGADGNFYKSEEEYRRHSSATVLSTIDQMKLRDMITVPELPDPMEAMMKQTIDGLHKKEMAVIEDILRHHIDCPIDGELTHEKVKAAGIRGVMYSDEFPQSRIEDDGKEIRISITSGLMGVVQGDWLIGEGGARRPLTEKERDFYERQERMEQMAGKAQE